MVAIASICDTSLSTLYPRLLLIFFFHLFTTARADIVYNSTPSNWYYALQRCQDKGDKLSAANNNSLLEFSPYVKSSVGAWLGGRRVSTVLAWADNIPVFTSYGCFADALVNPHMIFLKNNVQDVLGCVSLCGTVSVALKVDRCLCLKDVPQANLTLDENSCSRLCAANFHERCGDVRTLSVYQRDQLSYTIEDRARSEMSPDRYQCGYLYHNTSGVTHPSLRFDFCGNTSVSRKYPFCQKCSANNGTVTQKTCTMTTGKYLTTWDEAISFCESLDMRLATPASGKQFLSHFDTHPLLWVGLRSEVDMSWIVAGSTTESFAPDTDLHNVDGDCVSVARSPQGSLSLQLENCGKLKPRFCDHDTQSTTETDQPGQNVTEGSNFTSTDTSVITTDNNEELQEGKSKPIGENMIPIYISLAVCSVVLLLFITVSLTYMHRNKVSKSTDVDSPPAGGIPAPVSQKTYTPT